MIESKFAKHMKSGLTEEESSNVQQRFWKQEVFQYLATKRAKRATTASATHGIQPYQNCDFLTFIMLHFRAYRFHLSPSIEAHLDSTMAHEILNIGLC